MKSPKTVDVDILVANYKNAPFLETFFESVLNSTVLPKQLVVVNDGSPDNSEEIIRSYAERYAFIKPVYLEKNVGYANALNAGIEYLTSTYTLRIDPDDYMYPDRIEKQYEYISESGYDVVGSNIQYFDSKTNKDLFKSNVTCDQKGIIKVFKSGACGIIHGSSIIRTQMLKKYGYVQANVPAEDYDLFSKIITGGGRVMNVPETLTAVRVHLNSVSNALPFSTIRKTFDLTEKIWGIHHNRVYVRIKHLHLKYYRRFLFESNPLKKYGSLIISCLMSPGKVVKRLFR